MSREVTAPETFVRASVIDPASERVCAVERMMEESLSRQQMRELHDALVAVLMPYAANEPDNERYLREFIETKRVENCTERTIRFYETTISRLLAYVGKPVRAFDATDVRRCQAWAIERGCSPVTANNERRCLSSFFQWLEDESVIRRSPVKKTKEMRVERVDKKPFSDEEVARIRDACKDVRERAVVELLLSSGMRVSELCGLDRRDVNWETCECFVMGKGRKGRVCYFSAEAKLYLERYVKSRDDAEPALFVASMRPHARLSASRIEVMMRDVGRRAGVEGVHPHRFRRTMATNRLRRGMPLEEIQQLLGHESVSTTLIYAKVDRDMLRVNARRLG